MNLVPFYLNHKHVLLVYWLAIGIFFSFHLVGQSTSIQYKFISPNKVPGFPNAEITCLFQDSYGFVWIGTTEGLYRFNGYECTLFEPIFGDTTSIPGNYISYQAFHEDQDHNLWIATFEAGFVKFDRKTERFQRLQNKEGNSNSLALNEVNVIQGDGKGDVWIGTKGRGLDHYSTINRSFRHYKLPDGKKDTLMGHNLIVDICRSRSGDTWIGTQLGVARLDAKGKFHRYFPEDGRTDKLSSHFATDIYEDRRGQIWIATISGLNRWVTRDSFVQYFPTNSLQLGTTSNHDYIFRIYEDNEAKFWVGTNGGLLKFDPDHQPNFQWVKPNSQDPFSINPGMIYAIMEDQQSNLWFAPKSGLSILNKKATIFKDNPSVTKLLGGSTGKNNLEIQDILATEDKLWIAIKQGLYVSERNKVRRLIKDDCTALYLTSDGKLYVGTVGNNNFVYVIDSQTGDITKKIPKLVAPIYRSTKYPIGTHITTITEDCYHNLWLGSKGCLNRYDSKKRIYRQFFQYLDQPNSLSSPVINDLYPDKNGNLWIATNAGVNVLNKSELRRPIEDTLLNFKHFHHDPLNPNTIGSDKVNCIFEDSRDWFWFGTELGISIRYPNGRWKRLTRRDGLPGNKITRILEDQAGNIWISAENNGLARYDVHGHFQNFGQADGLFSERFPSGAMSLNDEGQLILASTGGIQYLNPQNIKTLEGNKPLYLTQVKLFNRPVVPGGKDGLLKQAPYLSKKITLAYEQDVLTLQFTTLNFTNPDKQAYRYRLAGFKSLKQWQYLGTQRDIHLTNLFPGKYILEVESTTNPDRRAHWESRNTIFIQVRWPWYWQWWAILLYVLGIVSVIRLVYLFRKNLRNNRELRQKSDNYDYVTHEFRTPLTIILGMVELIQSQPDVWLQEGLEKIQRNGGRLLQLVNQLLDISRFDAGLMHTVNWQQGDVLPFLRYLYESFSSYAQAKGIGMEFSADLQELQMDYDPDKLQKIISNLLSNALKFTPAGGLVQLSLSQTPKNQLWIEVKDTGPGIADRDLQRIFERFHRGGNALQYQGIGIGLALTKALVHLLGGQIKVRSKLGEGTVFNVELPIHRNAALAGGFSKASADPVQIPVQTILPTTSEVTNLPLVLIVEDNPDLVDYLRACLQPNYNVAVAMDGEAGIEQALAIGPDIIISDVMMPKKDGFEMCRTLKNDARTSHIPIILLTALAETEDRLRGLEDGADAYLSKPFLQKELEICMRKALELREKIKEYFSNPTNAPETPTIKKQHEFVVALNAFLEENYARPLSVTELAAAFHFSEAQLRDKLGSLLHHKPQRYILLYRLKKAEERLLFKNESIEEIAAKTGFSDGSHFSNAFLEEYGMRPGEYRKRKR